MSLLAEEELTVAELTSITELPQSRVSTHLGRLREAELLRDRRAGASTYYRINDGSMPEEARRLWDLVRSELDDPTLEADGGRRAKVVRSRDSAGWPDRIAGQMERHYSPGRTWEALARAFLSLLDLGDVLDVGAGDGTIAELLAPRARSITCLDKSEKLVAAARARLGAHAHIDVLSADMHALPFDTPSFDLVLLSNVLGYTRKPKKVLSEAARVLREDGRLLVTALAPHKHRALTDGYGHVNAGMSPATIEKTMKAAGLTVDFAEVTSRERKKPHFRVVTALGRKREKRSR